MSTLVTKLAYIRIVSRGVAKPLPTTMGSVCVRDSLPPFSVRGIRRCSPSSGDSIRQERRGRQSSAHFVMRHLRRCTVRKPTKFCLVIFRPALSGRGTNWHHQLRPFASAVANIVGDIQSRRIALARGIRTPLAPKALNFLETSIRLAAAQYKSAYNSGRPNARRFSDTSVLGGCRRGCQDFSDAPPGGSGRGITGGSQSALAFRLR
jgi:hypothetical protein